MAVFEGDSVGLRNSFPVSGKGFIASATLGDGNVSLWCSNTVVGPALEGVTSSGRSFKRDSATRNSVCVGIICMVGAAIEVVGNGVFDSFPVGSVGFVASATSRNLDGGLSSSAVAASPTFEVVAISGRILERDFVAIYGVA